MPRPALDPAVVEKALLDWVLASLASGAPLNHKSYQEWNRVQPAPRPPSSTTIIKRFAPDGTWGDVLLAAKSRITDLPVALSIEAELPVRCAGQGRIEWDRRRIEAWLEDSGCRCECCQDPSIAEAHTELVPLLADPEEAALSVRKWVSWRVCPLDVPTHRTFMGTVAAMAAGELYCGGCRRDQQFLEAHAPGSVVDGYEDCVRSRQEEAVTTALTAAAPELEVRADLGVALSSRYHGGLALKPDIVLPALRVAIEIDGGNGKASRYSRHDTPEGAEDDALRDRLLAQVGWRVLRVRHPDALELVDSPALVITTATSSPTQTAQLILDAVPQLRS